jgi:hypothetical protein
MGGFGRAVELFRLPDEKPVRGCDWIADFLEHGLLCGSFTQPTEIQDLRNLERYRAEPTHMASKNNSQSSLKFGIHGVVVERWSILPLVVDTQPRMFTDESQITGAGGANIFAGHRISE